MSGMKTIIIIDALDECHQTNMSNQTLLPYLHHLQQRGLSLFVTSRDEKGFHDAFSDLPSISTEIKGNKLDIETFIESSLKEQSKLSKLPKGLQDEIKQALMKKSQGL